MRFTKDIKNISTISSEKIGFFKKVLYFCISYQIILSIIIRGYVEMPG